MIADRSIYVKIWSLTALSCILLLISITDAEAATRRQCNQNLVITEVAQLDFGNFVGSIAGSVTVSTSGARSSAGPLLVGGGSVSPGIFTLHTTISGCETYPVRVRFNNGNLTGAGANMTVDNFVSNPVSETFYLNPGANNPVTVAIGADVSSGANQTADTYIGTYRVRFTLRRP